MTDEQNQNRAAEGRSDSEALLADAGFRDPTPNDCDDCETCMHVFEASDPEGNSVFRCTLLDVELERNGICNLFAYFDD